MGDDLKQCFEKDRFDRCENDRCRQEEFISCKDRSDEWGLGDWLPVLLIVFLLSGGTNIFGGGRDDCCENNGFGGSWLLILLLIFLFLGNQREGKGFLGGLFG